MYVYMYVQIRQLMYHSGKNNWSSNQLGKSEAIKDSVVPNCIISIMW